jgi:hypothetical protein
MTAAAAPDLEAFRRNAEIAPLDATLRSFLPELQEAAHAAVAIDGTQDGMAVALDAAHANFRLLRAKLRILAAIAARVPRPRICSTCRSAMDEHSDRVPTNHGICNTCAGRVRARFSGSYADLPLENDGMTLRDAG